MRISLRKKCILLFFFLLPWQTVYLVWDVFVDGEKWQYATIALYASDIVLIALLLLYAKDFFSYLKKEKRPPHAIVLLLFIAYILFSGMTALDPVKGISAALHMIAALGLFYIITKIKNPYPLFISFLISMTLVSILAIAQFLMQSSWNTSLLGLTALDPSTGGTSVIEIGATAGTDGGRWLRAYGSLPHPNILGGFLTASILLSFFCLLHAKTKMSRIILFTSMLLMSAALFFSFSRSAWCATIVGLVLILLWFFIKKRALFPKIIIIYTCLAILIIAVALPYKEILLTRTTGETRLEKKSLTDRAQYVAHAKTLIATHPFTGVGVGNYTHSVRAAFPDKKIWTYQPVHNVLLLALAEMGVIGGILLCTTIVLSLTHKKKAVRTCPLYTAIFFIIISPFLFLDHWLWTLPSGLYLFLSTCALVYTLIPARPSSSFVQRAEKRETRSRR